MKICLVKGYMGVSDKVWVKQVHKTLIGGAWGVLSPDLLVFSYISSLYKGQTLLVGKPNVRGLSKVST